MGAGVLKSMRYCLLPELSLYSRFLPMRTHEKIRKLREAKSLTQEYMAHELNISPKTYSRIENGESPLKVEQLLKISELLEVTVQDLISSDPVSIYIGPNTHSSVYSSQSGDINNYHAGGNELEEMKKQIARLEAAMEKLLKGK